MGKPGRPVGLLWAEAEKYEVKDRWSRLGMARHAALMSSRERRHFRRRINRTSRGPSRRQMALVRTKVKIGAKWLKEVGAWAGKSARALCAGREDGDLVAKMTKGGRTRLLRGRERLPSVNHRPKSSQPSRDANPCPSLLLVTLIISTLIVLAWGLGREVLASKLGGMTSIQLIEAAWVTDYVDAAAREMLRIGVHHLVCTFWYAKAVVSAHTRQRNYKRQLVLAWGMRVAGAKAATSTEEESTLDSGEEEEGEEEEQRKALQGNPSSWEINPTQVMRRLTKASSEVGRLRCRAAVRLQSKVFCLYLYD